jgi:hypothetical protein
MSEQVPTYEGWAIVELMGHVRLAGRVSEESHFGVALGRIDIPTAAGDSYTTQYFGGSSIYRITPTTEEIARSIAAHNQPKPVQSWELPKPAALTAEQIEYAADHPSNDPEDQYDGDRDWADEE